MPGWNGMMAPKGTPPAVDREAERGAERGAQPGRFSARFNAMGFKPGAGTPGPMAKQIEADMRLFTTVIRERNLKFDCSRAAEWHHQRVYARLRRAIATRGFGAAATKVPGWSLASLASAGAGSRHGAGLVPRQRP